MEIIPVIDLLHGQVVRAQRGERDRYQPIRSQLCDSSEPIEVARALLKLYPFKTLYIADLNAIQGTGNHVAAIAKLHQSFPDTELWLDSGLRHSGQWPFSMYPDIKCVIGSEGLQSLNQYVQLTAELPNNIALLSLDFSHNSFIGPDALLQNPQLWPRQVICMTLARVGSYDGPDIEKLGELSALAGERQMYAAGGIRNIEDLRRLKQQGVAGSLLASALHDGRIDPHQFAELVA